MAKKPGAGGIIVVAIVLGLAAAFLIWKLERDRTRQSKQYLESGVVATKDIKLHSQITRDKLILQNIKVFFVDKGVTETSGTPGANSSITLLVSPDVAELVAAAERKAVLKLALRPAHDETEVPRSVPDISQILALLSHAQKVE